MYFCSAQIIFSQFSCFLGRERIEMMLFSQAPGGALSAKRCPAPAAAAAFSKSRRPPLFSESRPRFHSRNPRSPRLALSNADGAVANSGDPTPSSLPAPSPSSSSSSSSFPGAAPEDAEERFSVAGDSVPLEGVIQFERTGGATSKFVTWAQVGLLAGGDVLCLLIFSAVGRFSHGFQVLDLETLRTADPFIAGWVLSAYFFGGYGDDGRGKNGSAKAITAAVKSWSVGIPLGIIIRAATSGHIPPSNFMLVTMGSTGILLNAWRALVCNFLPNAQSKQNDVYKSGSPFELFELLTSLIRRW